MRVFRLMACLKICFLINFAILFITLIYLVGSFLKKNIQNGGQNFEDNLETSNMPGRVTRSEDGDEVFRVFYERRKDPVETETRRSTTKDYYTFNKVSFKRQTENLQHKIVHLDLKGAPPKMEYLISLLPELQKAGASGILLEYEDMFPFDGEIENIKAKNAYRRRDVYKY